MSKKKAGGLPYLRTTTKFDFNSMESMSDVDKLAFQENLKIKLLPLTTSFDLSAIEPSRGHELQNEQIAIGMNSVFQQIAINNAKYVLLDSQLTKSITIANIIALYVKNSGAEAFSIDNLTNLLSTINITADILSITANCEELNNLLSESQMKPISNPSNFNQPIVSSSQGKVNKQKSRK